MSTQSPQVLRSSPGLFGSGQNAKLEATTQDYTNYLTQSLWPFYTSYDNSMLLLSKYKIDGSWKASKLSQYGNNLTRLK